MRLMLPLLIATAACSPTLSEGGQRAQGEQTGPATPVMPPAGATCDAAKAQFTVGQVYTAALAERARVAADARTVRRLVPGQVVTMEFNGSRLNLDTDAGGRVTSARCG